MRKTKKAEEELARKWCPMGRISIQNIEAGSVKVLSSGAFNTVYIGSKQYASAVCKGDMCPLYREGPPWKWGRCTLSSEPSVGASVTAILVVLSSGAIGGLFFFLLRGL